MTAARRFVPPLALLAAFLATGALAEDPAPPGLVATLPPAKDESHLYSVAFTKDGKSLVTMLGKTVHFWDTATWKERAKLTVPDEERQLVMMPDGKSFALLEGRHGKSPISVYDVESGEVSLPVELRPSVGPMNQIAVSDDGKLIVTAGSLNSAPTFWKIDATTGKFETTALPADNDQFYALALSPDGKVAAAGFNRNTFVVPVVELATGKELFRLKVGEHMAKRLAFSADGKMLAAAGLEEPIRIFDLATGKVLAKFDHQYASCIQFSPDGKLLLSSDREEFCLWDVAAKSLVGVFGRKGVIKEIHNGNTVANGPEAGACFSPDGKWVAWGCEMEEWGTVRVFEVAALLKAAGGK